ncbi:hypothetical protein SJI00_08535 [Pseudomonas sp. RP23018S]|nr:hypothetical protein [Pseudomonas sp. RP23018S]MDZ5602819.1 hypothetical protein [Pseudomonas sp. RP23018S]
MSQALILQMMDEGQIFDSTKMRAWLTAQRGAVAIPSIEFSHAILVQ